MQLKIHKLEVTYNVKEQQRIIKVWIACDIFDDLRANYFTSNLDVDTWWLHVRQLKLSHASDAPT